MLYEHIHVGNLLLSASILFNGALPGKVLRVLKTIDCAAISDRTYYRHQESYLIPSINTMWNTCQGVYLEALKKLGKPLVIGGDARADSPGHSAKFGSYTVTDLEHHHILNVELVQVCLVHYYNYALYNHVEQ